MKYRIIFPIALFLCLTEIQSQEYLQMIEAETYSVQEIVDNAEAYFADKDKGKGTGYTQFKRWEYNALRLMNENGFLPTVTEQLNEVEQFNAYLNENSENQQFLNDDWQDLGPFDWNATSAWSPGVGRITGISVDMSNNDHIIVGANTGGVWKTTDGGVNWTPLGDYFSNLSVYSVAIDPTNSDTYFFGSSSGLIYKSTDAGATWNQLADLSNSRVIKILIDPTNTNKIFACSENAGFFKTVDGGSTWNSITTDVKAYDIEFKPGDVSVMYASGSAFQKSIDGGVTFTTVGGFMSGPKMIGVSPDDDTVVYVLEAAGGSFGAFYKSIDSGASFTQLNHTGRNYFGYDTAGIQSGGQAPRDMAIAVNPNDVNEVHIAGVLTWRSMDAGVTFNITSDWVPGNAAAANIGYCHADVDIFEFVNATLFVGTDGGIFKATDTGTVTANYYTDITAGLGIRQFYKIGVSQTPDVVITGGSQDNGSSFYKLADGWRDWIGADGMEGFVDKDNPNYMYGTIQFGEMYKTTNGGISISGIVEPGSGQGDWVTPFEQDPTITNTIYVGYNFVYKSTNQGGQWTAISQNFVGNLDHLKIAPSNNQIMYVSNGSFIYRTEDGGATDWVQTTLPGGSINSIAIHPTNPNKVAVALASNNKVYVSDDGGTTWQNYKLNLPNFAALAVVWDDNGQDGLYLGMNYGIFYIDNSFSEWQVYNNNLPNVIVNELDINTSTNMLYAGTYGRGLWVSPLVEDVLGTDTYLSVDNVVLYPNPASSELSIEVPYPIEADIRVFDITGKLVIYQPDVQVVERHSLAISALQTGTYFMRVNSSRGSVTKKFIKN
jgi:photosystem II stability/assembly factor-like uncharacterized protein